MVNQKYFDSTSTVQWWLTSEIVPWKLGIDIVKKIHPTTAEEHGSYN